MALVHDKQEVFGEEVEQAIGTLTRLASIKIAAIVLNTRAMPKLANHLDVIGDTLEQTLRLKLFSLTFKESNLLAKVILNLHDGTLLSILRRHEEVGRIDLVAIIELNTDKRLVIKFFYTFYFISPEGHAKHEITIGEGYIHSVSFHAIFTSGKADIVADI